MILIIIPQVSLLLSLSLFCRHQTQVLDMMQLQLAMADDFSDAVAAVVKTACDFLTTLVNHLGKLCGGFPCTILRVSMG